MASTKRPRDSVVLTTKVCGYNDRYDWFRDSGAATQLTKAQILESVDKSLSRLGTDYIDLLTFHWPERSVGLVGTPGERAREMATYQEQVEAMGELITSGKIRAWGVSNENAEGISEFVKACTDASVPLPVCVQNAYSLLQVSRHGAAHAPRPVCRRHPVPCPPNPDLPSRLCCAFAAGRRARPAQRAQRCAP
jgi:aryl-alcohol dehydrogenase-like predicted oxidoreductase